MPPSPPRRPKGGAEPLSRAGHKEEGVGSPPRPVPGPPAPRAEWCAHWPDGIRAPRPLAERLEKHTATVAGGQSEGGGRTGERTGGGRAGRRARGHGGCGTAGDSPALAAVRRPRRSAGRLVLPLLPRLRPTEPRSPLPQHPALGARRRRGPQRSLVGSIPGHAETGARWVTPGGQCAGGRQPSGGQQTAGAPSRVQPAVARVPNPEGQMAFWKRFSRVVTVFARTPRLLRLVGFCFLAAGVWNAWSRRCARGPFGLAAGSSLWAAAVETLPVPRFCSGP